jgi:hypothetical protein
MTQHTPPTDEPTHSHSDGRRYSSDRSGQPGRHRSLDQLFELSSPIRFSSSPFAWQHGPRLYLLVQDRLTWVLAEMVFVPIDCHYLEVRRTLFQWPREAAGVLLSRAIATDERTCVKLAEDIDDWMSAAASNRPVRGRVQ